MKRNKDNRTVPTDPPPLGHPDREEWNRTLDRALIPALRSLASHAHPHVRGGLWRDALRRAEDRGGHQSTPKEETPAAP